MQDHRLALKVLTNPIKRNQQYQQLPNQRIPPWAKLRVLYQACTDPHGSISRGIRDLGDFYAFDLGKCSYVVIANPQTLSLLFKDLGWNLATQMNVALRDSEPRKMAVPGFLQLTDGPYHSYFRHLGAKQFTQQRIHNYMELWDCQFRELSRNWCASNQIDYAASSYEMTFQSVCRGILGIKMSRDDMARFLKFRRRGSRLVRLYGLFGSTLTSPFSPLVIGYRLILQELKCIIRGAVAASGSCPISSGLIPDFVKHKVNQSGHMFGVSKIVDEALGYLAASESIAGTATWAVRILLDRPDIVKNIRNETATVIATSKTKSLGYGDLAYTRCVILETLRMYPAFPAISRSAIEEMTVNGFVIPQKCTIVVPIFNIHRDPRWFKEPNCFSPERWSSNTSGADQSCSFIPFGLDHHRCIGWEVALAEITMQIACLFHYYDVTSAVPLRPSLVSEIPYVMDGLSLRLKEKLYLNLSQRIFEV
jgi:cytochrome P450